MLASQMIERYVKEDEEENVGVICILDNGSWYHVHTDEKIPDEGQLALHVRSQRV